MSKSSEAAADHWAHQAQTQIVLAGSALTAIERIRHIVVATQYLDKALVQAVASAKDDRWTWTAIAEPLHLSMATCHRRFQNSVRQARVRRDAA
jgi:hypothetical protein